MPTPDAGQADAVQRDGTLEQAAIGAPAPPDDETGAEEASPGGETAIDPERLVFFSDAVIAIAMTLLVIDLRLPDATAFTSDEALRAALGAIVPQAFSFALSFAVIGLWWTGHHRLFRVVRGHDGRLAAINMAFLGAIAFLPFSTSVLGHGTSWPTAVILYAATNAVIASLLVVLRTYALRRGFVDATADRAEYRRRSRLTGLTGLLFAGSIPIALVSPTAGVVSWISVGIATLAAYRTHRR